MITIDSDPKLNPVYIGARILTEMASSEFTQVGVEDLYDVVRRELGVSYEVFVCALDWLYVAGAIDLNENGLIEYAAA
ncbi:ABC-three component system middle component 6 [Azotobacter salinestris]|uniref:ABC-three component system middle component 6 n=1 Tax=Azotobacter salinestris TaxID=69964 RepID=UPI001266A043|nr:ABC-three component system middle component 6 [Azotobacter salinestris]